MNINNIKSLEIAKNFIYLISLLNKFVANITVGILTDKLTLKWNSQSWKIL